MAISPLMFLLESLLDKIGHHYYCPYTSKLNYTIQTPARYEVKLDAKALTSVLIAHFGGVIAVLHRSLKVGKIAIVLI